MKSLSVIAARRKWLCMSLFAYSSFQVSSCFCFYLTSHLHEGAFARCSTFADILVHQTRMIIPIWQEISQSPSQYIEDPAGSEQEGVDRNPGSLFLGAQDRAMSELLHLGNLHPALGVSTFEQSQPQAMFLGEVMCHEQPIFVSSCISCRI